MSDTTAVVTEETVDAVASVAAAADPSVWAQSMATNSVYLMGTSFILGCLFTIFVLLILDFMRRNNTDD